jgi:hypothetical protein
MGEVMGRCMGRFAGDIGVISKKWCHYHFIWVKISFVNTYFILFIRKALILFRKLFNPM